MPPQIKLSNYCVFPKFGDVTQVINFGKNHWTGSSATGLASVEE